MDEEKVLVADTDNHLLRLVALTQGTVTTMGGTGRQTEMKLSEVPHSPLLFIKWDKYVQIFLRGNCRKERISLSVSTKN